ncbi:MAG: ABC transporter ATP-binding protein [Planctomycetes bacterium]|nr:ABC transporter ATP-binding protein [Planctomycetota bacterium]
MARPQAVNDTFSRFRQVMRHFTPELRKEKMLIAGSMMALLSSVAFRLLEPWPLKLVIDQAQYWNNPKKTDFLQRFDSFEPTTLLTLTALSFVVIVALRSTSDYLKTVSFALIGNRVMTRIRGKLYRHLQALSLSFHDKARSGDLLVRMIGDIKLMRDVAVSALLPLMGSVLVLIGMVTVMFLLNWQLALLSMIVVPLFGLSTVKLGRRIHSAARLQRQREGAMAVTASEAIASVKVIQALSLESHFDKSFTSENKRSLKEGVKTRRLAARLERTTDILTAVAMAGVLWYGAKLTIAGELEATTLIPFATYLKRGFRPMQDFAKYAGRLAKATAAGERIVELLEQTSDVQEAPDAVEAPKLRGALQFSDVHFGYEPDAPVYKGLSFSVDAGTYVAIAGHSGAGKSTLLSLLLRLYDPQEGRILIDGQDIRQWTLNSLRGNISVVLQDTVLFAANVYDNIALGATGVEREAIETAAKLANAHNFIEALPQGYDTMLGERAVNLSHGQRQRIAIARAAVRDAPLLLLDEPTTGLDEQNERQVRDALRRLAAGRTTLLVTHDLRQTADADMVLFIENGLVQEAATHELLLEQNGTYAKLYRSQTGAHDLPFESNPI